MTVYIKSFFVGVMAVIIVLLISALIVLTWVTLTSRNLPSDETIGWDPIHMFRSSLLPWFVSLIAFVGGFSWQLRRVRPVRK